MYSRQMQESDESWLRNQIDEHDLNEPSLNHQDYVMVSESGADGMPCGFGRVYHYTHDDRNYVKLAQITIFEGYDTSKVRSLIYKALLQKALEYDSDTAYVVSEDAPDVPFEFKECDPDEEGVSVNREFDYSESPRLFRANVFKALDKQTKEERVANLADEFGYDDDATTKYSID